jgi:hypothetical protein
VGETVYLLALVGAAVALAAVVIGWSGPEEEPSDDESIGR